ncbi:MAG: SDR family oxidoreductase [Bacteroidota bacterium]
MNKLVLLTGASGGIGKAIIPILAKKGFVLALQANNRAEELSEWISKLGIQNCHVFQKELTTELSCSELVSEVEEHLGNISYLMNNAGINRSASSHKLASNDWEEVLQVNLSVPFYLSKAVSAAMIDRNFGRIVHMASVVGQMPVAGTIAYAASKAGLIGMARAQAADWAKYGITVNCIAPGYLDKGMIQEVPEQMIDRLKQQIPAKSLGNAEKVANLLVYLFSDEADYVNGETININGGLL